MTHDQRIKSGILGHITIAFSLALFLWFFFAPPPIPAHAFTVSLVVPTDPNDTGQMQICVKWKDPFGNYHITCRPR